jgi:hypothetical protein
VDVEVQRRRTLERPAYLGARRQRTAGLGEAAGGDLGAVLEAALRAPADVDDVGRHGGNGHEDGRQTRKR